MARMEFKNVSFSYGEFPAVKDFSYSFERGKTYCRDRMAVVNPLYSAL